MTLGVSGANGYGGNGHGGIGFGGGIANAGTVSMNGCTLFGNSVHVGQCFAGAGYGGEFGGQGYWGGITAGYSFGGGVDTVGTLMMSQCTLSGNNAWNQGGGVYCINSTNIVSNCTFSGNEAYDESGGGIYQSETYPGMVALTNTIVAGNFAPSDANISGPPSLFCIAYCLTNGAPLLAPLSNYGGPTQTMPPLPGSPAIGAGSVTANTFTNDQRGYPRVFNGLIDIGAVELPTINSWTANPTNSPVGSPVQFSGPNVDSDGSTITSWNWNFGDPATGFGQDPTYSYSKPGSFSPNLFVIDSLGLTLAASGSSITTFYLFTVSPTNGYVPLTVEFDCPAMDASGNIITNWIWNFGDGTTSTNERPAHTYVVTGTFTPYLAVLDDQGNRVQGSGPLIIVSSVPEITRVRLSDNNLNITGVNGLAGDTYYVLSSTNLAMPLSQWMPVATSSWSVNGNFNLAVTNVITRFVPQEFYILQIQQ